MNLLPLFLLTTALLSACSSNTPPSQEDTPQVDNASQVETVPDENDLENLTNSIVNALQSGEYSTAVSYFNSTLLEALDEKALEGAWVSTVSPLGEYSGERSIQVEGAKVTIIENYGVQNLLITLTFDETVKLSGINLNYTQEKAEMTESELFTEEEVTIATEEHLPLGGFLTLPEGVERPPVVLLVQGSGSTDRNSTIYQNVPFQDIAHGLAEKGIASLRYDKRFFAYPEEAQSLGLQITLENEILDDVSTALKILENDSRLGDIYVLGHSLGGMLTPSIATENPVVKGIISMAGSPQPLYEISYAQNKESEAFIKENVTDKETLDTLALQMEQVEADILTLRGDFSDLPPETQLIGLPVVYQQSVKENAGENFLDELEIPMLILQGNEDFQVSPTLDFGLYQEMLGERENVTFKLYEGLNHLMMESSGVRDVSDYQEKKVVAPQVIEDIAEFIK